MVAQAGVGRRLVGVVTGNIVMVTLNETVVGVIQNVGFQEGYGHQPVTGLGRVNAYEHAPGQARFSLSCDFFRMRKTIVNDYIPSSVRNLEDSGIVPVRAENILAGLVFNIQVLDLIEGTPLWTWIDCSYDGGNMNVRKHDIVSQSCQFLAIDRRLGS